MSKRISHKLTEAKCRALPKPEKGNKLYFDAKLTNLALRVTAGNSRSWVLCYRIHGPERRITIGKFPALSPELARDEAQRIQVELINKEIDPLDAKKQKRDAYTLDQWSKIYIEEHAKPSKKPASVKADERHIQILKEYFDKNIKFANIKRADIRRMHTSMSDTPRQANKVLATLSHMFTCAIADEVEGVIMNPVKGIKRNQEEGRDRFLDGEELQNFITTLGSLTCEAREDIDQATTKRERNLAVLHLTQYRLIEFMLLTGSRRGETEQARWKDVGFERNVWVKPSHHTKQNKREEIPLSDAAQSLLKTWKEEPKRSEGSDLIFPGSRPDVHVDYPREAWKRLLKQAEITDLHLHDLRHTYASQLVIGGLSLPIVGKLMGHTTSATTEKYAHLADDPLREATEIMGGLVSGMKTSKANLKSHKGGKK
jgi:integrase